MERRVGSKKEHRIDASVSVPLMIDSTQSWITWSVESSAKLRWTGSVSPSTGRYSPFTYSSIVITSVADMKLCGAKGWKIGSS